VLATRARRRGRGTGPARRLEIGWSAEPGAGQRSVAGGCYLDGLCDGTRAASIVLAATAPRLASRRRRGAYMRVPPALPSNDAHASGKQEQAEHSGRRNCSAVIQLGASTLPRTGLARMLALALSVLRD
jgi:hypothetical protein